MKFHHAAPAFLYLAVSTSAFGSYPLAFGSPSIATNIKSIRNNKILQPLRGGAVQANNDVASSLSSTSLSTSTVSENETTCDELVTDFVSKENLEVLSTRGKTALTNLIQGDIDRAQTHVYANWPPAGEDDEEKIKLCEQVSVLVDIFCHE